MVETIDLDVGQKFESKPSLKLTRNSKGYTWEIKILSLDTAEVEKINDWFLNKYGNEGIL